MKAEPEKRTIDRFDEARVSASARRYLSYERYLAAVGQEIGCSSWIHVPQSRIDGFADVTMDHQFVHVNPTAAALGPFGGTVSHGFLTLSLLAPMSIEVLPWIEGSDASINYGIDGLRFLAPVRSGTHVRGRFHLAGLEKRGTAYLASYDVTIENDASSKPAIALTWKILFNMGAPKLCRP